ncbi:MAG: helix-turn-helix transcriptional regulator [Chryseotalea sp. WA131a]|jgi:transcriptional regulator with XRE-family HTH domain|nr:MAG: helix-turn-helix transcriptional regulator [Chryseotalea sp. WA131a]
MQIGTRLRQLRESKGYSQQNVADYLEMEQPNYQKLESDKAQPKLDLLEKLADFYKVSLVDLISSEKNSVHIQNNNHNHNGVVMGDAELFQLCIKSKEEIIKAKDDMISHLQKELESLRKKH